MSINQSGPIDTLPELFVTFSLEQKLMAARYFEKSWGKFSDNPIFQRELVELIDTAPEDKLWTVVRAIGQLEFSDKKALERLAKLFSKLNHAQQDELIRFLARLPVSTKETLMTVVGFLNSSRETRVRHLGMAMMEASLAQHPHLAKSFLNENGVQRLLAEALADTDSRIYWAALGMLQNTETVIHDQEVIALIRKATVHENLNLVSELDTILRTLPGHCLDGVLGMMR